MSKISLLLFVVITLSLSTFAQKKNDGKELRDAVDRVNAASKVMREIMSVRDRSIPRDLLQKAKAIVVFPGSIKAAFIIGGQGGKGVAIRRLAKGWSAPAFLNMGGGSVGFQIGGQKTDYVLLVMNDEGLTNLLADKFEMGGEGSVAAGPVGRTAAATTNATLDAQILTYSRSKGLFAGVSLKGVVISQDQDMNNAVYQKSAREILISSPLPSSAAPATLRKFGETVATYAR
jgi:lipid-binding SYLF domain-containing protein